jgi:hypothetical protein
MYVKLFSKILDSSVWLEPDPVRIAWITILAAMNEDGFCQFASVKNLALRANIALDDAKTAVETFESPDPDSSDPEHEGRRIERVPGGWMVLNSKKYRDLAKAEHLKEQTRARVRGFRAKKHSIIKGNANVTQGNENVTPSDVDVDVEPEAKETSKPAAQNDEIVFQIAKSYPKLSHLNSDAELNPVICQKIILAIETDGAEKVLRGTLAYAAQLQERKFCIKAEKFFGDFEYRAHTGNGLKAPAPGQSFAERNSQ